MSLKQLHAFFTGTVQGVGFRYTTKALACGFEITGTVRNLMNGKVELVAEGEREELEAFRQGIMESELGHFIRDEQITWAGPKNSFRGFEIVR